jgi:hypothetical protein
MNIERIEIGSTPYDEDCAQVGSVNYSSNANKEMKAYINQLNRMFPDAESKGVNFKVKWFNHDFGTYGEVCIVWNTDNAIADEYAYVVDADIPGSWDDEARKELGI